MPATRPSRGPAAPAPSGRSSSWALAGVLLAGGIAAATMLWPRGEPSTATPDRATRSQRAPSAQAPAPTRQAPPRAVAPRTPRAALRLESEPAADDPAEAAPEWLEPALEPDAGAALPHAAAAHPLPQPLPPSSPGGEPPAEAKRAERPPRQRQVNLTALRRWRQPGICSRPDEARAAHEQLLARFRRGDGLSAGAQLYLDPRLEPGAELPVLGYVQDAERILQQELQLAPGPPDVLLYQDSQLLLAAACTNADVVAYYDGALHVVAADPDLRASVIHEFTHHALMTAGIIGPAWAQEGIAMHVAREEWWLRRELLERVSQRPFSIDSMETAIPYTLVTEQAVLFYVQAGAMVECATRDTPEGIAGLVGALNMLPEGDMLSYQLPVLAEPSRFQSCMARLLENPTSDPR
jgi:hypothetical protein